MRFEQESNLNVELPVVQHQDSQDEIMRKEQIKTPFDPEQLYHSKAKFLEFLEEIGDHKYSKLRQDVVKQCKNYKFREPQKLKHGDIKKIVNNRIEKMIKNRRIKKNWSIEDVKIMVWIISKYLDYNNIGSIERQMVKEDWENIAALIPGVDAENCMFKWLSLKKITLTENSWSENESLILTKIIRENGEEDWYQISKQLYYRNTSQKKIYRSAKQCRQQWNCYLNPKLKKGPWSKEEDELLFSSIKNNNGQKRWAEMVKHFNGRTENALKNRFSLIIQKMLKEYPKGISQQELVDEYLQKAFLQEIVDLNKENQSQRIISKNQKQKNKKVKVSRRRSSRKKKSVRKFTDYSHEENSIEPHFHSRLQQNFASQIHDSYPMSHSLVASQSFASFCLPQSIPLSQINYQLNCDQDSCHQDSYEISMMQDQKSKALVDKNKNVENTQQKDSKQEDNRDEKENERRGRHRVFEGIGEVEIITMSEDVLKSLWECYDCQYVPCIPLDNKLVVFHS